MKIEKLNGLIAAPFTPMLSDGNLNLKVIEKYADHLISARIAGVFICGTTGEGISMTKTERMLVLEEWIRCAGKKLKVISHVGGNCIEECKELASHAEKTGAYAVSAFAPSFFKPSNAQNLIEFLEKIAASAPTLPFYYYNIPGFTGVNIPVSSILALAKNKIPTFAGVKFTHFDLYEMQKCMAFDGGKYDIVHGYDETLLCGLSLGVQSAIGSTYNYIPEVYIQLWEAFNYGDLDSARKFQRLSVGIVDILNKYGGGVVAGKAIMKLIGIDCGDCRLPINKFSRDELKSLKDDLEQVGFFSTVYHSNEL
jgi:N-acetylneuraminate lyase